ncbi:hypothetical protein FHR81_001457 [Actinoalloteichus hoggarensis]|nr:cytochrome P450 [Actinoalloteichus hoggarensis]MBB5920427.1 hypothetical protein [Actinoalloteichus hoggarensis]
MPAARYAREDVQLGAGAAVLMALSSANMEEPPSRMR